MKQNSLIDMCIELRKQFDEERKTMFGIQYKI